MDGALRTLQQLLPLCRQPYASRCPVKQGNAELLFKVADLSTNGGLRAERLVRGNSKAAMLANQQECLKQLQIYIGEGLGC
jgi:hypothetical protein